MKNLFIIDGLAGTGKSDFLEYIKEAYSGKNFYVNCLPKYSTREKRKYEQNESYYLDLIFINNNDFQTMANIDNNFYKYEYSKHWYGFYKNDLDNSISKYQNTFIIVRNIQLIKQLIKDYSHTNVIPIFIYSDNERIRERLIKENLTETEIENRIERSKKPLEDYMSYSVNLYKEVLINNSSKNEFKNLINQLIDKYNKIENKYSIIKPLIGYADKIENKLTNYEKNVFLMIKYRENNEAIRDSIKWTLFKHGFNAICADDENWNITNDVYNTMAVSQCCKYGIALFDEPENDQVFNPNVAYELGIMQTMHRECLIIKHSSITNYNFFDTLKDIGKKYSTDSELKSIIKDWLMTLEK